MTSSSRGLRADRTTLADRIYRRLEDEILSGQIEPGSRLLITHLADRFGTSQAPVREAIRRLTEQGLAVTEPYVGTVLKEPSWSETEEIYELRTELEVLAVRRILSRTPVKLRSDYPAKRAFRELQRAVRAGFSMEVIDADMEFHRMVCSVADSPVLLELWSMITKRIRGVRLSYEIRRPDDLSTMVDTHRVLLAAIESGDPAVAERAFREHLESALRRLRSVSELSDAPRPDQRRAAAERVGAGLRPSAGSPARSQDTRLPAGAGRGPVSVGKDSGYIVEAARGGATDHRSADGDLPTNDEYATEAPA